MFPRMQRQWVLFLFVVDMIHADFIPWGIQSEYDIGDNIAKSIFLNDDNTLYVTGITNGHVFDDSSSIPRNTTGCFVGSANVGQTWSQTSVLSTEFSMEGCLASTMSRDELYAAGYMQSGGLLEPLRIPGSNDAAVSGMILQTNGIHLLGGSLLHDFAVTFPVSIVTDKTLPEYLYVLSAVSTDHKESQVSDDLEYHKDNEYRDVSIGSEFLMYVERLHVDDVADTSTTIQDGSVKVNWEKPFGLADVSVYPKGLTQIGDALVVVGYTRGQGGVFGNKVDDADLSMDGIIVKLSTSTGNPYDSTSSIHRIITKGDDLVMDICSFDDQNYFYVAGTTAGNIANDNDIVNSNKQAFLMKLRIDTMEMEWVRQVGALGNNLNDVLGIKCAADDDIVYLSGIAKSGAIVEPGHHKTTRDDDIFVVQYDNDGTQKYIQQVGTNGDETVRDLKMDRDGHAIVAGSTTDSLFRVRGNENDIMKDVFVMNLSKETGLSKAIVGQEQQDPNDIPTTDPPVVVQDDGTDNNDGTDGTPIVGAPENNTDDTILTPSSKNRFGSTLIALFLIVVVVFGSVYYAQMKKNKHYGYKKQPDITPTDRSKLYDYLKEFDVEDVDLRHSATGGWHASYVNGLAQGMNRVQLHNNNTSPQEEGLFIQEDVSSSLLLLPNNNHNHESLFISDQDQIMLGNNNDTYSGFDIGEVDHNDDDENDMDHTTLHPLRRNRGISGPEKDRWGREII